ncbi:hypothetical protein FB451DRAFT_381890 [Mycena latifolia]|nr:hypothetical protein FB451DRAFT_381890 [Mycena latifolia]
MTFVAFQRPLIPRDWERPLMYWNRIRDFQIMSFEPRIISPDVCQILQLCCPGQYLFPNLQEISWLVDDPAVFPLISMFLSPRIHSISIIPGDSIAQRSLLPTLAVKYPDLTEVNLRGAHLRVFDTPFLQIIWAFLGKLQRLESLFVANVDFTTFEHLARLPSLKCLVLDQLLDESLLGGPEAIELEPRFPSLEFLSLWSTTPEITIAVVAAMHHRALSELRVNFETDFPDIHTTTELYTTLATHCSHATLHCLSLEEEYCYAHPSHLLELPPANEFSNYAVRPSTLQLLFPFTNLTTIKLSPYHGFDLDDETVLEMARAWCRVEELELSATTDLHVPSYRTRVTLMGIRAIAMHCSNLKSLRFFFNASGRKDPLPAGTCAQTTLVDLYVFCSPISSPAPVANFLFHLFPNLRSVHSHCLKSEVDGVRSSAVRRWVKVERLLRGKSED